MAQLVKREISNSGIVVFSLVVTILIISIGYFSYRAGNNDGFINGYYNGSVDTYRDYATLLGGEACNDFKLENLKQCLDVNCTQKINATEVFYLDGQWKNGSKMYTLCFSKVQQVLIESQIINVTRGKYGMV